MRQRNLASLHYAYVLCPKNKILCPNNKSDEILNHRGTIENCIQNNHFTTFSDYSHFCIFSHLNKILEEKLNLDQLIQREWALVFANIPHKQDIIDTCGKFSCNAMVDHITRNGILTLQLWLNHITPIRPLQCHMKKTLKIAESNGPNIGKCQRNEAEFCHIAIILICVNHLKSNFNWYYTDCDEYKHGTFWKKFQVKR